MRSGGQVRDGRPPGPNHLANVALIQRAQAQPLDVGALEPTVRDEGQGLGAAIEAEDAAEVDAGHVAHGFERAPGRQHEIVAGPARDHDRVQDFELAAALLVVLWRLLRLG